MPRIPTPLTWKRRNFAVFEHLGMIDRLYAVAVSGLVSGPFAIYKHPHANGFVLIHLPSQAKIIELEMQHVCKHAAEKFAALDLNWWTCLPEEVIGPDLQEMRNIHERLKPTPWVASDWGGGTGERAPPVLSAQIRALKPLGAGFLPVPLHPPDPLWYDSTVALDDVLFALLAFWAIYLTRLQVFPFKKNLLVLL